MSAQFTFDFHGDDIGQHGDASMEVDPNSNGAQLPTLRLDSSLPQIGAETLDLDKVLSTLPSKISYSTMEIDSPKGRRLHIPHREYFDIRMQLMAEDENLSSGPGLSDTDIETNVYEGGYKSWECSIDLAKLLLDRGPRKDIDDLCRVDQVVELGCGTALPSLVLFQHAISSGLSLYFTLADYNASALRLVTLPNLLLTWAKTTSCGTLDSLISSPDGDLEITPELTASFKSSLAESGITISLIAGAWSPRLVDLIPTAPEMSLLVLASETIYSPASLSAFTETLVGILQRVKMGKAMMGAKRMYFGVGGSVDAFKEECARMNAVAYEIESHGVEGLDGHGVRRCLLEVQMM